MSIKLTRKLSFHRKQINNDCWLYSACALISNYLFRYDLKQHSSLFENYDNDCDFDFTKQQKFTNFKDFVNDSNLQEILQLYSIRPNCRAEIYYYFLFFFLYFIGMKTSKIEKFNKGNNVLIFVNSLINNLKYHLLFYKQKFIKYLLTKITDTPSSPDSFHSPPIVEALDSPDTPETDIFDSASSTLDDEMIGGTGPHLTTERFAKMLLPSWFYSRSSPTPYVKLAQLKEVLETIVQNIYLLIQRLILFENVEINYFYFTSKQFNNINLVKEKFENILESSYILSDYTYYSDPNEKKLLSYRYPCYKKDKTNKDDSFVIVNEDHVFVMQEFIPSTTDTNDWSIIVKDSNSLCRGAISKDQCQDFSFDQFVYLSSINNTCRLSFPFMFETTYLPLKTSIIEIDSTFFTTEHSPRIKDILFYIQEVIQPIIKYIYEKKQRNSYLQLTCNDNKVLMSIISHRYKKPVYTETNVGKGKKKTKKNKLNIYVKKNNKKKLFSNNTAVW